MTFFSLRGTSRGPVRGIPPNNKPVMVRGMDFFRIANGKIVELRRVFDADDLFRQLKTPAD